MKRIKIALVNPGPLDAVLDEKRRGTVVASQPPLGILYISAMLKRENYHVDVIDQVAYGYDLEQILKWIKRKDPDVLGLSTITLSFFSLNAIAIAKEIKKWNPNIKIVFGNKHATYNDVRILKKYDFVDVCVRHEGENTILELLNAFSKQLPLKNIRGITFSENGRIIRNEERERIKDLDALPFPDRKSLKVPYKAGFGVLELVPSGYTSLTTSRGCPRKCTFCDGTRTRGYRARSIENVIEELDYLQNEGYKFVNFIDDNFTLNRKRVMKLCSLMKKNKIELDWACSGRVDQAAPEMLEDMQRKNCRMLFYGMESANQRILNYYKKGITPRQMISAVKNARRAKIPILVGSFILGAPGETLQEILNTLKFLTKLDIDYPALNVLFSMPGTDIWDDLVEKKIIDAEKYWETGVVVPDVDPSGVPTSKIYDLIIEMLKKFIMRPKYILKEIYMNFTNSYRLRNGIRVLINNLKNFKQFRGTRSLAWCGKHKPLDEY
ncbi:MAG: B12-binding domain-containing radical SAM protein [Promethearchaeota archaeon]